MLQHLPPAEAVAQLQDVMRDLAILNDSLRSLLSDSAPGHEAQHDQLVHFRGRVARRISRYALLVRKSQILVDRLLHLQEQQMHGSNAAAQGAERQGAAPLAPLAPAALPSLPSLSCFLSLSLSAPGTDASKAAAAARLQREQLLQLQQYHQQNLQTFKSQLSAWWQRTERHFHTMRMANYVNALEATENQAPSGHAPHAHAVGKLAEEAHATRPTGEAASAQAGGPQGASSFAGGALGFTEDSVPREEGRRAEARNAKDEAATLLNSSDVRPDVQRKASGEDGESGEKRQSQLRDTRAVMAEELQRMQETQRQLQKSSAAIEQTESTYNVFGDRLASAKGILAALKKRAETDSQLIWFAFLFFLGCCAFVVLRRLGIIRLIISTACMACSIFSGFFATLLSNLEVTDLRPQDILPSSLSSDSNFAPVLPASLPYEPPAAPPLHLSESDGVSSPEHTSQPVVDLSLPSLTHAVEEPGASAGPPVSTRTREVSSCTPQGQGYSRSPSNSESCHAPEPPSAQFSFSPMGKNRNRLASSPASASTSGSSPAASQLSDSPRSTDSIAPVSPPSSSRVSSSASSSSPSSPSTSLLRPPLSPTGLGEDRAAVDGDGSERRVFAAGSRSESEASNGREGRAESEDVEARDDDEASEEGEDREGVEDMEDMDEKADREGEHAEAHKDRDANDRNEEEDPKQ
ncbi:conserved hypothetical protein [Neospora caninum Liverpool]|nr:conserved hypothetical protein [Neospora caninum Liverpool]CBZ55829.1 conserved hypothetical protein [Neospora caninum Liverpool]|eukprot:XP_003885855.1 conserved hypothetical protein [Neospora caninum Liverpool]